MIAAPVACLNRSIVMCVALPTPLVASVIGRFLESAIISAIDLTSSLLLMISTWGA